MEPITWHTITRATARGYVAVTRPLPTPIARSIIAGLRRARPGALYRLQPELHMMGDPERYARALVGAL